MKVVLGTLLLILLACVLLVPAATAATSSKGVKAPLFAEEAIPAGVEHRYDGEWQFYVGGGVAVLDCDDDRRPDLYFAGGATPAGLYRNQSPPEGALAFTRVPAANTDISEVTGAYPLDIDGDDVIDLAVLRRGENVFLRGLGECRFERANEAWGIDGEDDWSVAFSAKWEPGASLPTMAIGDYLTIVEPGQVPDCDESALFRPADDDGYAPPEALSPGYCSLSMLFSDWDRSGRRDLRVANDRQYSSDGEDQLWRVDPGQPARAYSREDGWQRLRVWGMGIASHDLTRDGYPEYYVTSMGDNKLQTLADGPERPTYSDVAFEARATVAQPFAGGDVLPSTAWHAEFDDVNNDGSIDLYVSKGNVEAMPDHATSDPNNLLLGRPNGRFKEGAKAAGILNYERGRGAALVDLNQDGLLDLVEVNRREPVHLWRNVGSGTADTAEAMGHWLAVELNQAGPNHDAIGAWIEVRAAGETTGETMSREVTIGGGHASGERGPAHFGLAGADAAEVRVQWPDGEWTAWMPVAADHFVTLTRGEDAPVAWPPTDEAS